MWYSSEIFWTLVFLLQRICLQTPSVCFIRCAVIMPDILQHSMTQLFPPLRREVHDFAVSSSVKVSMRLSTAQLFRWRDYRCINQLAGSGSERTAHAFSTFGLVLERGALGEVPSLIRLQLMQTRVFSDCESISQNHR